MFQDHIQKPSSLKLQNRSLASLRPPVSRSGDRFAVASFIDETEHQKSFLRIWDTFDSIRAAEDYSKQLMDEKFDYFDLYVLDLKKWIRVPFTSNVEEKDELEKARERYVGKEKELFNELLNRIENTRKNPKRRHAKDVFAEKLLNAAKELLKDMSKDDFEVKNAMENIEAKMKLVIEAIRKEQEEDNKGSFFTKHDTTLEEKKHPLPLTMGH